MVAKAIHADNQTHAAKALEAAGFPVEATTMYWISLRTSVFEWLERHSVPYEGTRDALVKAMSDPQVACVRNDLAFAYLVGTMAEWEEDFGVSQTQLDVFKTALQAVRGRLCCGSVSTAGETHGI